jgi:hypothetical protein
MFFNEIKFGVYNVKFQTTVGHLVPKEKKLFSVSVFEAPHYDRIFLDHLCLPTVTFVLALALIRDQTHARIR